MKNKNPRILIAGYEIGGQMQLLAETFRENGFEATSVAFNDDFRFFSNDIKVNPKNWFERFFFFLWAIQHYDVFHFFWGVSLLSIWRFHLIDLPILKLLGKKIIPHFRGLDIVDIKYFDYLRNTTNGIAEQEPKMSRKDQIRKLKKWYRYSSKLLVSEPDLFYVAKKSILSPQVIDVDYWTRNKKPLSEKDGIIRIVHAPSSRRKKGTEYLEYAIKKLKEKGYNIELILAENIQSHAIKDFYLKADIGVDQLLYGWHGKVSCELMALSIPVVCYINPKFGKYRTDLPIVNANPNNLVEQLEILINDKSLRKSIGEKSLKYVKKYHDVNVEIYNLLDLYGIEYTDKKNNLKQKNVKTW